MLRQTVLKLRQSQAFLKISWALKTEENYSYCENIEDFRKVLLHIYSKIANVSLKPFTSKK